MAASSHTARTRSSSRKRRPVGASSAATSNDARKAQQIDDALLPLPPNHSTASVKSATSKLIANESKAATVETPPTLARRLIPRGHRKTKTTAEYQEAEPDLLQISFRTHHCAYAPNDGSGAAVIHRYTDLSMFQQVWQFILSFSLVHYIWFALLGMIALIWLIRIGHWYISAAFVALYLPSFLDRKEYSGNGRSNSAFRHAKFWRLIQRYNSMLMIREQKLPVIDPRTGLKRTYIFATYPHGILILSRVSQYGGSFERMFPGLETRALGATPMFLSPGCRDVVMAMGAIDANRKTATEALSKYRHSLIIFPGGSKEIFLTEGFETKNKVTTIIGRKGFIRLALQQGASIVPSLVFGERNCFHVLHLPQWLTRAAMRIKLPLIAFYGRFGSWLPLRKPNTHMSVVYGRVIDILDPIAEPTDAQIDEVYERFHAQLQVMFHRYKEHFGYAEDEVLRVIDPRESTLSTDKSEKNNTESAVKETESGAAHVELPSKSRSRSSKKR